MSVILTPTPDRDQFERITRTSDVYSEPPASDLQNAFMVALMLYTVAALCTLVHYLDAVHVPLLWPDGWRIYIDLMAFVCTALATWTVLWYLELEWCWRRRYPSFVYWLYRHDVTRPPHLTPAVYAGETVNPRNRIRGHERDGRQHWRKQDWAKGIDMRIIRVTRPSKREAVENRAKLYGSWQAKIHGQFWGGAEGFMGAKVTGKRERIETIPALFWVAVWSWGAICFPRHYGFGRAHRTVWQSVVRRLAHK